MMYVVMGIHPLSRWVVNWHGNMDDAVKERDRCNSAGRPDTVYKIFSLLEVDP